MWPLVVITIPPVTTPDDIEYMQRCYEHVFASPVRHALIVDTTSIVRVPDATLRRQMKAFEDSRRPIIRLKNIGSAIIIQRIHGTALDLAAARAEQSLPDRGGRRPLVRAGD
jgi:hypothetical protein